MKILRLFLIVVFGALLFMALRLPDDWRGDAQESAALPRADFRRLAAAEWKAGRHGSAALLLNYAIENRLPDAEACAGAREGYLAVMETDRSPAGPLAMLGLNRPFPAAGGFDSLSGVTVADWFVTGASAPMTANDELSAQLAVARELTGMFPPAAPALRLAETVWRAGLLRDGLRAQLERALRGMAASADGSAAVAAVQETVMPLFQLARQCRTWAEFAVLLRHADSVDQLKLLTRMASLAPVNAVKLARPLIAAEAESRPDMPALIMDFIVRRGQIGMDAMDQALRRGTAGMDWLLRNPGMPVDMLDEARPEYWPPAAWRAAWHAWRRQAGRTAVLAKALAVILLCMGILVCLLPGRMLRAPADAPPSGAPPSGARGFYAWYWTVVLLLSVAVGALLMLGGDRALPAGAVASAGGGAGIAPAAAASAYAPQQLLSWMVILAAILLVQGTCWELARRRIRNVAENPDSDATVKLRQLDNLDIFFDLPLYAGLALTILAFILISTLGAGVSRFLAYASTFVGILFAVALRLGHLYPLREKLIMQNASQTLDSRNPQNNVTREKA